MKELFGISMDSLASFLLLAVGLILLVLGGMGWRNRVIVRLGLRNIPRRRAQTSLIVLGLMLSTLIIAAAFGTGDTMTYSFRAWMLDELGELDELVSVGATSDFSNSDDLVYFDYGHFQSLSDEIARLQAEGDSDALKIEELLPLITLDGTPVINRTARQNEPSVLVVGAEAATASKLGEMTTVEGQRVSEDDLGAGEVYINQATADELAAEPGHQLEIYLSENPTTVTVKAIVKQGAAGSLHMPLADLQAAVGRPGEVNAIMVSNVGGPYAGAKHSSSVARVLIKSLGDDSNLQVQKIKQNSLQIVELLGSAFTTIFIGFGSFSIAAGLLLIFLIFVMLAAERKQEMGMARAVGMRRRHLVQMFVFEGAMYDLAAAAVGALLGIGVGLLTVRVLAEGLGNAMSADAAGFSLRYHIEPRSVIVAYCLGVLLTFITVTVSSWRVSRLNIVSAIRDLPPPPNPDAGLRALFVHPWSVLVDVFRQLLRLRLHLVLKRVLWDGPMSSLSFFWALIGRGPLTALLGLLWLLSSLNNHNAFLFQLGVSLILIGIGLMARWFMRLRRTRPERRDRIAFSFAGISLLVFWSLPFDALDFMNLPEMRGGPEMFVLSGIMMVAGAVWTIMYNSDLLLGLLAHLLSRFGSLLPVIRTAIAYPMSNKFRTGLTLAIFALTMFTLVFMSVFVHIFNQTFGVENLEELTGGYDLQVEVSKINPIPNLAEAIANLEQGELESSDFEVLAGLDTRYVDARQSGAEQDWNDYPVRILDDVYMESSDTDFVLLADGYATPRDAWLAVRDNPGLAVVDSFAVPRRESFSYVIGGPGFRIEGMYLEDERMDPIPVQIRDPETGAEFELSIIGVVEPDAFYMDGIFVSQAMWRAETGLEAPPTTYYVKLADGVDVKQTAQALEATFLEHGLESSIIIDDIKASRSMNDAMMGLIQGFMGLGLVVGSASLGIISTRAVVERRHQIGVLRAIGYRPWMIQGSFLLESSFVALLGIFIGLGLGLILSYNFYNGEVSTSGPGVELAFAVPWMQLGAIVAIAYAASLLTTFLPAWQAARVYPAEALRYE